MNLEETLRVLDRHTRPEGFGERIDYTVSLTPDGEWVVRYRNHVSRAQLGALRGQLDGASASRVAFPRDATLAEAFTDLGTEGGEADGDQGR